MNWDDIILALAFAVMGASMTLSILVAYYVHKYIKEHGA
ncbi:hypothetical protein SMF1_0017 [Sulfolobales Mexican fusellovirus 1]|nr:hypothetical protein SMF1_0017 [Sulfolobales Mexican fusellovirus 1]AGG36564.1 hypothetical protein SMF1_0017 [Sulfolobales Mexican fusellovirus 1]